VCNCQSIERPDHGLLSREYGTILTFATIKFRDEFSLDSCAHVSCVTFGVQRRYALVSYFRNGYDILLYLGTFIAEFG